MPTWEQIADKELEDFSGSGGPAVGSVTLAEFQAGTYGTELHMIIQRHDLESNPRAKAEINWTWRVGPGWDVKGTDIASTTKDKINASTDAGKLFKALTKFPELANLLSDDWSPKTIKSWRELIKAGDFEWTWVEETPMKRLDDGTFVPNKDPDAKPKTILLPTKFFPKGGTNGKVESVDLASLGLTDDQMTAAIDAAKSPGDYGTFAVALAGFGSAAVNGIISKPDDGARLREQLKAIS